MRYRIEKDEIGELQLPAEAYYGIPLCIKKVAIGFLDDYLKDCLKTVINKFWF